MINIGRLYAKRGLSKEPKAEQKEASPERTEIEEAPLVGVNAHVELIDYCAQMTQTQRFRNNENAPLEATYEFELPKGCAVSSFSADVGDRHLTGKVKEKEKAAEDYDDAIASGHSAAMLQSTDENPNIFSVQLGNIPPGVEAFVTITFEKLANVDEGKIVLTLDGSDAQSVVFAEPSAAEAALDARVQPGFHFDVHIPKNSSLGISSPSHPIAIETNDNGTTVRLAENADWRARKDFVLEVTIPDPHVPKIRLQKNDNAQVAMASFYPKIEAKQTKCEMIFVLDRSGSMSGSAIECAKSTVQFFLRSLPEDAFFNIISFGSTFEMFSSESVPFNDDTLRAATALVSKFSANLGGTNIYDPLKNIFEKPIKSGYPRQVFILTDGEVMNKESCIELVKTNANTTRLFAFGIGNGVDKDLVNRMARAGQGSSSIIRESSSIRECVMKQLERAIQPGLTDINITWKDAATDEPLPEGCVRQTPLNPPPIFRGTRLVSFAILPEDCPKCKAVLTGSFGDSQYTSEAEFDPASAEIVPGDQIIKLGVRSLIEDIQNGCGGIPADKQDEIKKAVVELSVKHSILSQFTAFVAIGSVGEALEASMITRRVSRRIPTGHFMPMSMNGPVQFMPMNGQGQFMPMNGQGQFMPMNGQGQFMPMNGQGQFMSMNGQGPYNPSVIGQGPYNPSVIGQGPYNPSVIGQGPYNPPVNGQSPYYKSVVGQDQFMSMTPFPVVSAVKRRGLLGSPCENKSCGRRRSPCEKKSCERLPKKKSCEIPLEKKSSEIPYPSVDDICYPACSERRMRPSETEEACRMPPKMPKRARAEACETEDPALSKTLDNVILQQKASGRFNVKALALLDIPDSAKAAIPKSLPAGLDAKTAEDVWITLLVLVGLQRKHGDRACEWSFLAKKSENWVRSKLGDAYDAWKSCAELAQNSSSWGCSVQ